MRNRRRPYTTAIPSSFFPQAITAEPIAQPNRGSKKTKKCIRYLDLNNISSDLLPLILSQLGIKANIQASAVCKKWREAVVSVRKWQPRPWLFYREKGSKDGTYILYDTLQCQTYKKCFPELGNSFSLCYSRDGWLLVRTYYPSVLLLLVNPFTSERIHLPNGSGYYSSFSASPISSSCFVISFVRQLNSCLEIKTWRPGTTVWTTHCFENQLQGRSWIKCVFSNGLFYCLSTDGCLGVFDPSLTTWNILPVKPCRPSFTTQILFIEHEGDIFVMYKLDNTKNNMSVFKLNLKRKVWEQKRELSGLTVFASYTTSLARAGLSAEERNRIYQLDDIRFESNGVCHFLGNENSSQPLLRPYLRHRIAWVDPPHNFNM